MSKNNEEWNFGESARSMEWILATDKEFQVKTLMQKLAIPYLLARIIVNRGIDTAEAAESFLNPKLKNLLPNPFTLKDMKEAAKYITQAILENKKIAILGDYDVDGATSSAMLYRFFGMLGIETIVYIPNRMTEGYGPSIQAMHSLKAQNVDFVITVDCGIVSFDALEEADKLGLGVIVIDHHIGTERLPKALAIINPNRIDEDFPHKHMAAVGVAFLFVIAVRAVLRENDWFRNIPEPNLMELLDLVALGTVCDVVSLTGINRAFVKLGLKLISQRKNLGLSILSDITRIESKPCSYHLGFIFGPRINAGGRVGEGHLGSRLLATDCPEEAKNISARLEELNNERKKYESIMLECAINQIEKNQSNKNPVICVSGQDWHIGILGILASRIKERYYRPVIVVSFINGIGKGSARSIPGIDFGAAIVSAKQSGILIDGGGHAMAGGFSIMEDKIDIFYDYLIQSFQKVDTHIEEARKLVIDVVINAHSLNQNFMNIIEEAAPFGSGNAQPRLVIMGVYVQKVWNMKPNHVIANVSEYANNSGKRIKCLLFKGAGSRLGNFLYQNIGKKINIVGYISTNPLNPSKIDFSLEDASS